MRKKVLSTILLLACVFGVFAYGGNGNGNGNGNDGDDNSGYVLVNGVWYPAGANDDGQLPELPEILKPPVTVDEYIDGP